MGQETLHYSIQSIRLPNDSYSYLDERSVPHTTLENLSRMNLLIGENNSGKSLLIRELFSKKWTFKSNFNLVLINESKNKFIKSIKEYGQKYRVRYDEFEEKLNLKTLSNIEYIEESSEIISSILELKSKIIKIYVENKDKTYYRDSGRQFTEVGQDLLKIYDESFDLLFKEYIRYFKELKTIPKFKKIFIPTFRGLRPLDDGYKYEDLYLKRIKDAYFKELADELLIFTGQSIYLDIKRYLLGGLHYRKLVREYEEYLSKNFFDNRLVALIPTEDNHILTIKIGDEKERPIYELGDGIQAIILITFPLFMRKDEYVILYIDEPEKFLHPGFQRKLLNTLLNENGFDNFLYYISTHSNHFLDITLDFSEVSIFAVKKDLKYTSGDEISPKFTIENLSHGDDNALRLLGVRTSSVFLSNCTIWVEGITDRWYFRRYLELYMTHLSESNKKFVSFIEDTHYSFLEYCGGNITHWSFLDNEDEPINEKRLCAKLFLIADKDDETKTAKSERYKKLKKALGNRYYRLKCKEVENLISPKVLNEVLKDYKEKDTPEICYEDYCDKNIGLYIDNLIDGKKRRSSYKKGNTIKDKQAFCKKALNHINSWEDLSDEAKSITVKIYKFICANNS